MMGMDEIGARQCRRQGGRQWVGGMAMQVGERPQRLPPQPAGLAVPLPARAEGDQFAVDVGGERAGQLERITLAAAE